MGRRRSAVMATGGKRDKSDPLFITALERGLMVLSAFSPGRPELSVREIAQLTGLPYPTTWRLCFTLEQCGYILTQPETGKLCPSARALTLGHATLSRYSIADIVYPHMQDITQRHAVGLSLGTRMGLEMVYLRRTYGSFVIFNRSSMPIVDAPTGWAYLAACDAAERTALLAQLQEAYPRSWTDFKAKFDRAYEGYLRDGYLMIFDMLNQPFNCVSMPMKGDGETLGLSCAGLGSIWPMEKLRVIGAELLEISRMLATRQE